MSSLAARSTTPTATTTAYTLSQQEQDELEEYKLQQQNQSQTSYISSPSREDRQHRGIAAKIHGITEKLHTLGGGGSHNNNKSDTDSCKSQSGQFFFSILKFDTYVSTLGNQYYR